MSSPNGRFPQTEDTTFSDPRGQAERITLVVPFRDSLPHLRPCLESLELAVHTDGAVHPVFCDNGAADGSRDLVDNFVAKVGGQVLDLPGMRVGEIRNSGAAAGTGPIISFVDSDCVVPPDYFSRVRNALRETDSHLVGSFYRLPADPHWTEAIWDRLHRRDDAGPSNFVPAGNMACLRSAFEAVGGFDPALISGEDADLCLRMRGAGFKALEVPSMEAVHLGNPKSLLAVVRKQIWHAMGMFATARSGRLDLPVVATFAYLATWAAASVLLLTGGGWVRPIGALLLVTSVPAATVVYRLTRRRRMVDPIKAVAVYHAYFVGRSIALGLIIRRSILGSRDTTGE